MKVVRTVLNGRDEETGFMHRALSRPTFKIHPYREACEQNETPPLGGS
jgi:hypothetical protein